MPRSHLLPWLLILLPAGFAGKMADASDWPQFLGPERNGVSPETGVRTSWPREGPPRLWEKSVGTGLSGPVVAGQRIILHHRQGDEEIVLCLDAATGKEHWHAASPTNYENDLRVPGDTGPRSTPAIAGDRVYTLGAEGRMLCLDLQTGRKVWERAVNDEYKVPKGYFGVCTSPLVEGKHVLVNIGGPSAGIIALDRETGKEAWRATDHEASYASPVAATIAGERRVVFFTRQGLVLLDPQNGAVRYSKPWRARIQASVNAASPLVVDDHIFVSACYGTGALLLRVRPAGVDEVWHSDAVMSQHFNTGVHRDGFLYGIDGRQEGGARLRCVDWKSGKVRWTQEGFGCASLLGVEGNILALTEAGELVLFAANPAAYRELARAAVLSAPCRAHMALANGRLYGRDGKRLVCWDLKK
jgi:outer membrane protein assembly factor BamB